MSPLLVANWKMNPRTLARAQTLFASYALKKKPRAGIVVCPPASFLPAMHALRKKKIGLQTIALGGQNIGPATEGAFTGNISPSMLKEFGAGYVIIGHSECRAQGETNELINQKVKTALAANLHVLLCVGEIERVHDGAEFSVIREQIAIALDGVTKSRMKRLTICYEPVWAIGTGNPASAAEAIEVGLFILRTIASVIGKHPRNAVRVLYGGSVNAENARDFLEHDVISGFLVGGESLSGRSLLGILHAITK